MKWGVPSVGCMINITVSIDTGAWFGLIIGHPLMMFPWMLALGLSIHLAMRVACNKDPNIFKRKLIWLNTKGQGSLASRFGGSTLAPMPTRFPTKAADYPISLGGMGEYRWANA